MYDGTNGCRVQTFPRLSESGMTGKAMQRVSNERLAQLGFAMESRTSFACSDWYPKVMAQSLERPAFAGEILASRSAAYCYDTGSRLLQSGQRRTHRPHQPERGHYGFLGLFERFRKSQGEPDTRTPPKGPVYDTNYPAKVEEAKSKLDKTAHSMMKARVVGLDNALLPDIADKHSQRRETNEQSIP